MTRLKFRCSLTIARFSWVNPSPALSGSIHLSGLYLLCEFSLLSLTWVEFPDLTFNDTFFKLLVKLSVWLSGSAPSIEEPMLSSTVSCLSFGITEEELSELLELACTTSFFKLWLSSILACLSFGNNAFALLGFLVLEETLDSFKSATASQRW